MTLTGTVKSSAQKLAVEKAVKRVPGVHGIAEELIIELPALHKRNDVDLAKRALHALSWNANLPADSVLVKVEAGWVTLTGTVEWQYQRESARLAVALLAGVCGVSNDIALRQRIATSAEIDADRIQIETFGR